MGLFHLTEGYSCLQVYWLLHAGHSVSTLLYRLATKKCSLLNDGQTLGRLEFQEKPTRSAIVGSVWTLYVLWTVVDAYFLGIEPRPRFQAIVDFATSNSHPGTTGVAGTCLALSLLALHNCRRFYQAMFVSIFSRHRTINVVHLLDNIILPIAVGLSVLAESPAFVQQTSGLSDLRSSLRWFQVPAIALFFFASKIQKDTLLQFAKMRRNRAGHIVTTNYKLPKGGWFDRLEISSPQLLAEVLIQISIGLSLGSLSAKTWFLFTTYVIANNVQLAYDKQLLYKAKFEDMPKTRKMLIPCLL